MTVERSLAVGRPASIESYVTTSSAVEVLPSIRGESTTGGRFNERVSRDAGGSLELMLDAE